MQNAKTTYTQEEYDNICKFLDEILDDIRKIDRADKDEILQHTVASFDAIRTEVRSKIVVA